MAKKSVKKNKTHGKPSINNTEYKNTMDVLGIDSDYSNYRRPKPIMIYRIYCQYRRILDKSKHSWGRESRYANDTYINRDIAYEVANKLENKYKEWFFTAKSEFEEPKNIHVNKQSSLPVDIILNLNDAETKIMTHFKKETEMRTAMHKKKVVDEIGGDGEKIETKTKRKPRKKAVTKSL